MPDHPRHLLALWSPSYSGDALDAHLDVLLKWAGEHAAGRAESDDVYVWWAKIRSQNRDGRLPHHADVLALDAQARDQVETHLYLTDYRSLYVADVGEVTDDDVREMQGELEHMPGYYAGHAIDFWFRLFDLRRLVTGDTVEVSAELKKLRNTGYHDRPLSLYGGMVDLPLIVYREQRAAWFSDKDALNEGRLWAESAAAHRSDAERMARDLRDNLFGREIWPLFGPATRSFLASAEAVFRLHRDDSGFDLSGAALSYAKAVETELNELLFSALRTAMRGKQPQEREVRVDGRLIDLGGQVPHQTLGALKRLLEHEQIVQSGVKQAMRHDHSWVLGVLPRELAALTELRNRGAHADVTRAAELEGVRRAVVGIAGEGLLNKLVRARLRVAAR